MLRTLANGVDKICLHTGNILDLNELKKKAGQNPTDELIESLKITLASWKPTNIDEPQKYIQIYRNGLRLVTLNENEDRKDFKISVKVFISCLKKEILIEALESVFEAVSSQTVDSLVLAYPSKSEEELLPGLQKMWEVLEDYVAKGKLFSIGVSDLDTEQFIALHKWAKVKPSIIQINLASCCVVPPALQEFTKANDVQLLTHSDPFELLPRSALTQVFASELGEQSPVVLHWAIRVQVHVKCRGVLNAKGYLVCLRKP